MGSRGPVAPDATIRNPNGGAAVAALWLIDRYGSRHVDIHERYFGRDRAFALSTPEAFPRLEVVTRNEEHV